MVLKDVALVTSFFVNQKRWRYKDGKTKIENIQDENEYDDENQNLCRQSKYKEIIIFDKNLFSYNIQPLKLYH